MHLLSRYAFPAFDVSFVAPFVMLSIIRHFKLREVGLLLCTLHVHVQQRHFSLIRPMSRFSLVLTRKRSDPEVEMTRLISTLRSEPSPEHRPL